MPELQGTAGRQLRLAAQIDPEWGPCPAAEFSHQAVSDVWQSGSTAAWEGCGVGFRCALEVLAAVPPAQRTAAAPTAAATFLLKSISISRCRC